MEELNCKHTNYERNLKGTSFMMPSLKDDKLVVFRADEDLEDDEQKKTDCLNLFLFA